MEYQPMAKIESKDPMVRGYLECAERCGLAPMEDGREGREALELAVAPRWSEKAEVKAQALCDEFLRAAEGLSGLDLLEPGQVGHDLWLTQNRHGAGFWDRGLGKLGEQLTEIAHWFGEMYAEFDEETEMLTLDGGR